MLVAYPIPNLTGGVSQQPANSRPIGQCESSVNAVPHPIEGLTKRPPANHVKELMTAPSNTPFIQPINRSATEQYVVVIDGTGTTGVKVFDLNGVEQTVNVDSNVASAYLTSSTPRDTFKMTTVADVSFIANTATTVAMDTTVTSKYSLDLTSPPFEALIDVKGSPASFEDLTLKILLSDVNLFDKEADDTTNTDDHDHPQFGSRRAIDGIKLDGNMSARMIASRINIESNYEATNRTTSSSAAVGNNETNVRKNRQDDNTSTVYLRNVAPADFNLTVDDGLNNALFLGIKDRVDNFSDLPPIAKHNMLIEVEGSPETEIDDYYVRFDRDGGSTAGVGKGRWVETTAGGLNNNYDFNTMPLILIRRPDTESDGRRKFDLKRADGVDPSSNVHADVKYEDFKFAPRQVGDALTNPDPSFVGLKITDIAFFKNRLVFIAGENVVLSETAQYFNFFRTTLTTLKDSAPIDVTVGGTSVNKLEAAVPFADQLVLFSSQAQFTLQGEGVLTPKTVSITPATNFDITSNLRPSVSGNSLFFGFPRGSFSGLREYYKTNDTDVQFDAIEISRDVPKYINGTIKTIASSSHENLVVALTDTDPTSLYVYRYFMAGTQRVQSAWTKFTFESRNIVDIFFRETSLYMVMTNGGKLVLEEMDMESGLKDDGVTYVTYLDRRVKRIGDGSFDQATGKTTWSTLGYNPTSSAQVVRNDGLILNVTDQGTGSISVEGDFDTDTVYIGEPYTMTYEFSEPVMQSESGGRRVPVVNGRQQIRYMTVIFDDTSFFSIKVTPEFGDTFTYPYSGKFIADGSATLGTLTVQDETFRVPVFAQTDKVKVELINDSPLPSNFQSATFEINYTTRVRQRL
jgi:hypothetical protein